LDSRITPPPGGKGGAHNHKQHHKTHGKK
jgi:hypothetical protein